MQDNPCIICVAITGSVPRKEDNPNIPISVDEQIESTHEAFEAGASIVHCHVRNEDQSVSSDPILFAKLREGIKKHCSGMVIQFSTGGRSGEGKERGEREEDGTVFTLEEEEEGDYGWEEKRVRSEFVERGG